MKGKKLGKQRMHVRRVRTKKGVKRVVVNRGVRKRKVVRMKWDLHGSNSPDNVKRWRKFYKDVEKAPSVEDIMGDDEDEKE